MYHNQFPHIDIAYASPGHTEFIMKIKTIAANLWFQYDINCTHDVSP